MVGVPRNHGKFEGCTDHGKEFSFVMIIEIILKNANHRSKKKTKKRRLSLRLTQPPFFIGASKIR